MSIGTASVLSSDIRHTQSATYRETRALNYALLLQTNIISEKYKRLIGLFPTLPWCPHQGEYAKHHGLADMAQRVDHQATGARGCLRSALHCAEGTEPCIQNQGP